MLDKGLPAAESLGGSFCMDNVWMVEEEVQGALQRRQHGSQLAGGLAMSSPPCSRCLLSPLQHTVHRSSLLLLLLLLSLLLQLLLLLSLPAVLLADAWRLC